MSHKDYGELMKFLLYFRDQYSDEVEFNRFVVDSLRRFVYDLRDFDVYISISPDSLKKPRPQNTPLNQPSAPDSLAGVRDAAE